MAIDTPPRSKTSTKPTDVPPNSTPSDSSSESRDLLAGLHWTSQRVLAVAAVLIALDAFAGWSYLASYFGYFRVPAEALGLSTGEILAQGARSILLPLTVIPVAFVAATPSRKLSAGASAVGGYILFLTYVAIAGHLASPPTILTHGAAAIAIAGIVFAARRGLGVGPVQRLILAAVGLLLLTTLPVASGILDATQKASAKQSTLKIITRDPILPGSTVNGGQFSYSNYVLLRESDSRYWLLRTDNQSTYSISKVDVVYIRY